MVSSQFREKCTTSATVIALLTKAARMYAVSSLPRALIPAPFFGVFLPNVSQRHLVEPKRRVLGLQHLLMNERRQ